LRIASSNSSGRSCVPIASRSPKPALVTNSVGTPRRSSSALVATVVPSSTRTLRRARIRRGEDLLDQLRRRLVRREELRNVQRPVGRDADPVVNVPPRSIQNDQPLPGAHRTLRASRRAFRAALALRRVARELDPRDGDHAEHRAAEREMRAAFPERPRRAGVSPRANAAATAAIASARAESARERRAKARHTRRAGTPSVSPRHCVFIAATPAIASPTTPYQRPSAIVDRGRRAIATAVPIHIGRHVSPRA
jgi:hypothetical protein